ncbi:hypothetical protein [Lysobacter changpingensis]|uniref:hypothetical protein n=1 Tax=Lysobacter changpingensis TaxID=2792784 RepID=UPI001A8F0487|nr:hypothetical protein [Lysobacter changpingensis]
MNAWQVGATVVHMLLCAAIVVFTIDVIRIRRNAGDSVREALLNRGVDRRIIVGIRPFGRRERHAVVDDDGQAAERLDEAAVRLPHGLDQVVLERVLVRVAVHRDRD